MGKMRSWSLLPARLQALRVELPPGEHSVSLRAGAPGGQAVGPTSEVRLRIQQGYNTYLIGVVPTLQSQPTTVSSASVVSPPAPAP